MNLSPEWVSFLSSLFGTVVGAILAYLFAVRQFRIQKEVEIKQKQIETALDYHQEMISNDFAAARYEADRIFEKHFAASSIKAFSSNLSEEEWRPIRIVLAYFRQLQLAVEYKQIDNQMVIDLLSKEFFWWYFMWLDKMVPDDWETRGNIDKLHKWFKKTMSPKSYEESKQLAMERRDERLSKLQSTQVINNQPAA